MKNFVRVLFLTAVVAASAVAGPIVVDGGWYGFCFGGSGSGATAGCQNDGVGVSGNPTTFTATGPVTLKVTDAFQKGDTFDVWVNSVLVFTTSAVPVAGGSTTDPDVAYLDPTYSHGSTNLGPGVYSVDIFVNASPYNDGGAYVSVDSTVPEPGTYALMASGLAALVALRRRRQ